MTAEGAIFANIAHFARVLRGAGLPIGPGRALEAVRAVEAAGIESRESLYWTLFSVFVNRRDQRDIFDQAFRLYWRDPKMLERMMAAMLPEAQGAAEPEKNAVARRLADALRGDRPPETTKADPESGDPDLIGLAWSDREILQTKDFADMSAAELAAAKRAMAALRLPLPEIATRRYRTGTHGARADLRATLRASLRGGGEIIDLRFRRRRMRPPPLVVLADISGSMEQYSRMFLHFLHALANDRDRVHTFLFGTKLTNVTRHLRAKDVDKALAKIAAAVPDWSGGTRIGACLAEFNLRWARRVLGQGAAVLFISDGLDRDAGVGLGHEFERLRKSARRLIWLNPLLRFDGFAPKSLGMRAIMPHVDDFRPAHNLKSLGEVVRALSAPPAEAPGRRWGLAA